MASGNEQSAPVMVVAVPMPAQSHLNQLLDLSTIISSFYNLPVHYISSSSHVRQVKLRYLNPLFLTKIQFHELPFPPFPSPAPTRGGSADQLFHLEPLLNVTLELRQPFLTLLQTLRSQAKKIVIIHDALLAFAVQDAASFPNVQLFAFDSTCSFTAFTIMREQAGSTFPIPEEIEIPDDLPSLEGCYTDVVMKYIPLQLEALKFRSGDIRNTCRMIESDYVDLLGQIQGNKMQWAVGPFYGYLRSIGEQNSSEIGKNKCVEWLDKQPPRSVIYISFGTTCSMTDEQVKELAMGMEESKIRFIWVLKDADRANVFAEKRGSVPELPKGFEERTGGVGMVVRGWAPQAEILRHASTGGFMSHCGWSSVLESISEGVPIAAWPMHTDQPRNAAFLSRVLKIGMVVRDWSRRNELVTASTVKEAVRTLISSEEGELMRKRAEELGGALRRATAEGGVSRMELEAFIDHIIN
ncbi:hypothetical protein SLE2022_136110 [Rubroshorea leprosula]